MTTRLLPFTGRVNLRATLRPITFSWGRFGPTGWVRTARTPEGPATLQISRDDTGIRGQAWGDGTEWILGRLEGWVGLLDDPGAFVTAHPLIGELHRRNLGVRFARSGLVFEAAVAAVLGQKVTGKEAATGLKGLSQRFSDPAPGPFDGMRLPPDPDRLAEAPYHAYHDLGIEKRRADTVRRLAADAGSIDRLAEATPGETAAFLRRYNGVGVWTVAETVAVSHGDADALSVGDFHLKHLVAWHLTGLPRGTDEGMVELLEPFRPHRGRVVRLLELAGTYPRYGPRQPVRSFSDY